MTTLPEVGIDVSGRVIILDDLQQELEAASVAVPNGLTITAPPGGAGGAFPPPAHPPLPEGARLFTYDGQGSPSDLPPEAEAVVAAYTPAPPAGADPLLQIRSAATFETLRDALVAYLERFGG
jgi:hypothetical protein